LIELGAERTYEPVEQLLAEMTSADVEERLVSLIGAYEEAFEHAEPRIRMTLGVYQDTWLWAHRDGSATSPRLRQGRRMRWLDTVLQPLALSEDRRQRLKTVLALAVGPDSLIVLKDVCDLSSTEASATLRCAALALNAELRPPLIRLIGRGRLAKEAASAAGAVVAVCAPRGSRNRRLPEGIS